MGAAAPAAPQLDDDQVTAVIAELAGADSVELKLTVADDQKQSAVRALGMDPLDAQIRQVVFFDTPNLDLDAQGVVVRARRIQGKGDDAIVKLRPVSVAELSPKLRATEGFGVEVDAMPGGFVCSGTLKRVPKRADVRAVAEGDAPISALYAKSQRRLVEEHAPGIELDSLAVLGPVFVLKLKFSPRGYDRRLVAELWLYPDSSTILELSTKCAPAEAFDVAAQTRAYLSDLGIELSGEQQTKTRKALEFFAAQLGGTNE
jgi:hypothetical protein